MVPRPTRIGLVGCGQWGRCILRDLVALGCEVTVAAPGEASRHRAEEGGAARIVSDAARLPSVDGLVVATPTETHAAVIESLLDRGVPIFTEKPMTADRASASSLARRAGDRLFVMDKWRYHPGVELLGELARREELGPVLGVRTTRMAWGNPHHDVDGVWILAPHDLSIGLEILGCLPAPRYAVAERYGETFLGLTGILGDNPWLTIEVSTRSPVNRREVRLHCRDGVATLADGYSDHVQVSRTTDRRHSSDRHDERRPISSELPLARELAAFVAHLAGGPPPRSSAAEGAAIVDRLATLRELASPKVARVNPPCAA